MKTSKYIISLVLAVWCALGNLYAVETSYYTSLNGKSGKELFDAVQAVSKTGYKSLSYNALWTAHCAIDINSDGYVWDMYSNATSYVCGGTAQGAQNPGSEGGCYNREHSIPKSWFGGTTSSGTPGTDLFHVVPVDGFINSKRQATAYGEVASATYTSISGCKLGSPKTISISNSILNTSGSSTPSCTQSKVFEPLDEYKGDLARGYFGTMVKWANGDYQTFTTSEGAAIFSTAYDAANYYGLTGYGVALLLKWHREDPVSQKEIDRNNGIQNQQGNRNPFIDYPELAEYIWGERSGEIVTLANLTPTFVEGYTPGTTTTYTVVLSRNGQLESITGLSGTYTLPTSSDPACEGWTFAGWSATKVTSTTSTPSLITSVNTGGTVYAVYSQATSNNAPHRAKMADTEVTFTPGTDTGETSVTKNNVTCTMTTMNNSSYYQIYANQSGTFSCSSGNITKIEFTCTASGTTNYGPGNASANVGTYAYNGSTGTWTGNAASVTISSTKQVRMSSLTITYSPDDSGDTGSTTYDSEPEDCRCSGQFDAHTVNASASDETITLTWADITGATNGYTVLIGTGVGYTTECSEPEIGSITNSNGNNTCAITGLVNGLVYTASVFANGTTTTCEGIIGTATATPIGCQAWADPTFTYTTPLTAGGGAVTPTIGSGYGTPTFTSSNTSVLTVDEDGKISPVSAGTATVTAHWPGDDTHCPKDVVSNTITVKGTVVLTFNANDGSDNPATTTQNFTYGEAQALTANTFSRTGYTFQGWSTSPSGTKVYENGASVTLTEATTLYAVWQANKHSVTFSQPENGGTFTVNGSSSSPVNNVDFGSTVTIVVTPTNSHFTVNTVTVSGDVVAGGSGNNWSFTMPDNDVTVTVTMTEETKYTVKWYVNNFATPETNYAGSTLAGIANPSIDCNGKTFQGWTETTNYSDDTAPADLFTNPSTKTMPSNNNTCYYAVFATVETTGSGSSSVMDELTRETTGVTGTSYSDWSGKISNSNAVYAGNSAGGNSSIQLRSDKSPSGIISTTSGGKATKVTIVWNSNTVSDRKLNVYGKNTAYEEVADLYDNNKCGTLIGNIICGTSTELTIEDDYEYIGLRSASGAMYLSSISITWSSGSGGSTTTYTGYTTSCAAPTEVTITFNANGGEGTMATQTVDYNTTATLTANAFTRTGYTFQGWAASANGEKVYNDKASVTLTSNLNLYAVWQKNSHKVSYTVNPAGSATVEVNSSSVTPQTIQYGEQVTVTITADDAYRISSVSATEVTLDGEGNTRTFTMPDADVAITVSMALISTHTVTWSVLGGEESNTVTYKEGAPIAFPATDPSGCNDKVFVGWTTDPILLTDDAPSLITSATMGVSDITYYAVFAAASSGSGGSASLTKMGSGDTFADDDNIVIVAKGTNYALYQETVSNTYVNNWTFDNKVETVASDAKNYLTLTSTGDYWYLGDNTNGYLYTSGSNNLAISDSKTEWTIEWDNTESAFTINGNSRYLSCRTDLTGSNKNLYRLGGTGTSTGIAFFDIYKYTTTTGTTTYSGYTTLCYEAYTRDFNNEGDYATFCFPYTIRHLDGATAYNVEGRYLNGTTLTGIQLVAETEELTAGQSYVIQSSATTMYAWYSPREKPANDTIHTQGLVGNLGEEVMSVPAGCYGLSGNQLRRVAEGANAKVGQYKAYFRLNGDVPKADASVTLPGSKTMHVIVDTPTDLDDVDALQSINWNEPVYNILGIRVGKDATGVLIQNGRKYLR